MKNKPSEIFDKSLKETYERCVMAEAEIRADERSKIIKRMTAYKQGVEDVMTYLEECRNQGYGLATAIKGLKYDKFIK